MTKTHRHGITFPEETKVQQHHKDATSIPRIVQRMRGGEQPSGNISEPKYIDMFDVPPYHQSLNIVTAINQKFAALPSAIRNRFQNSAREMIAFCEDPKNLEEAIKLGLAEKREVKVTPLEKEIEKKNSTPVETSKTSKTEEKEEK